MVGRNYQDLIREARIAKGHLEKALNASDGSMNARDREYLARKVNELEYDASHRHESDLKGIPLNSFDRYSAKKAIRHARLYRDNGKDLYDVNGQVLTQEEVKQTAADLVNYSNYFDSDSGRFLNAMVNTPESDFYSARQIAYLERIQKKVEEEIKPHLEGDSFSLRIYPFGKRREYAQKVINFAVGKGLRDKTPPEGFLETIKGKWYSPKTGMDSLRDALAQKIERDGLKVPAHVYDFAIQDLFRFYRKQKGEKE
ncbi:MAG: hypothetical protein WC494_00810 [Candidatus Pacearchaeota archaeon]